MHKPMAVLLGAALLATPVSAVDLGYQSAVNPGGFVGARVKLSLDGRATAPKPVAQLTVAPTRTVLSNEGRMTTSIGEGLAFNLSPGSKPTLSLAGVRADQALGLRPAGSPDGARMGLSDGGKVAIGVGAALLLAAGAFLVVTHCDESASSDDCP